MAKKTLAAVIIVLIIYGLIISCSSKTNPTGPSVPDGELPTPNLTLTPPLIPTFTETDTIDPLSTYTFTSTHTDTVEDTSTETYTQTYTESETPTDTHTIEPTSTHTALPSADGFEDEDDFYSSCTGMETDTVRDATIYPAGDEDWIMFSINGTKGVYVTVKTQVLNSGINPYLYESDATTDIYGMTNTSIVDGIETQVRYAILPAGTYFVKVWVPLGNYILHYSVEIITEDAVLPTSTETYTLEPTFTSSETPTPIDSWEPQDNDWTTAPQLTPGVYMWHASDYINNNWTDWAKLVLENNCKIAIQTGGDPITNGNAIFFYTAAGVPDTHYTYNSSLGSPFYTSISEIDCVAGTYYVKVYTYESIDSYYLNVSVLTSTPTYTLQPTDTVTNTPTPELTPDMYEFDDGCGGSRPIISGETQTRISFDTDDDWVHFTVNAHCLADITTSGGTGGDTYIQLYSDPCSGLITADDNSNGNGYSKISISLTPGLYGLKITSPNVPDEFNYNYTLNLQLTEYTHTPTNTATETHTNTHTATETGTDTNTATATNTHTNTATATNTALPGTVWTRTTAAAEFGRKAHFSCHAFNDGTGEKMWVFGGFDAHSASGNTPTFKSADGVTWTYVQQTNPMPDKLFHTSVVFNGKIFVMGGTGIGGSYPCNQVYSSTDVSDWTMVTGNAAFGVRGYAASVVFNDGSGDKIWIVGGENAMNLLNTAYCSADGISWTLKSTNSALARKLHTVLSYDNKLWVIGGVDALSGGNSLSDVWSSSDGITWTQVTASAAFGARAGHVSFVHQNRMWVIGGGNDTTTLGNAWSSTDGVTWTQISTNSSALQRDSFGGCIYENKMWIMSGFNVPDFDGKDVWWSY